MYIEQTQAEIERLSKELGGLQKEAETLYVFGQDQAAAERDLKVRSVQGLYSILRKCRLGGGFKRD